MSKNDKTLAKLKKAKDAKPARPAPLPEYAHLDPDAAHLLSSFERGLGKAVKAGNADPENNDIGGMDDGGL
jgi:hypothetical protein